MKCKITCAILCALFCLCAVFAACKNGEQSGDEPETVTYSADFSGGIPDDWKLYQGCDVSNARAEAGEGCVVLSHSNANINADKYHGGVYNVAMGLGSVSDFELSMTFSFVSYDNDTRWFCVYYHTRETDGKMNGYLMNVRVNGTSAQSTVSSVPVYTDTENVESGLNFADSSQHELKITVRDGVAVHSLDGKEMIEYTLASKSGLLGGFNGDGGFAVGVNRSSVKISSLSITGTKSESSHAAPSVAETYSPETSLVAAPSVITRINGEDDLAALKNEMRPATAILSVNDKLEVVAGKTVLGEFDAVLNEYFNGRVIPAVNVGNEKQAKKLAEWLTETETLDIAVISADAALVKSVRTAVPWVRGVVDYSAEKSVNTAHVVAETTSSLAHIAVLSQTAATKENVSYLQGRFKTVWVENGDSSEFGAAAIVSCGAYGIITANVGNAYAALKSYTEFNSMARMPLNIGHRGLPNASYENTVEGSYLAYQAGATHVEIDLKLTADKQIVIMHDDQISRTTNGSGIVGEMTLDQLRQYKVIKSYDGKTIGSGVNIPTLEEFYETFCNTDLVLVLEIKTADPEIIPVLKRITDEYDYYSNIVIIAFDIEQIEEMNRIMPETPTADLNGVSSSALVSSLYKFNFYNTTMDTGYGNASGEFLTRQLLDRGYMGFLWTYGNSAEISSHFTSGVLGMTNNDATAFSGYVNQLSVDGRYIVLAEGQSIEETLAAVTRTYGGDNAEVTANVFKKSADGKSVILSFRTANQYGIAYTVYSEAIKIVDARVFLTVEELTGGIDALPAKVSKADREEVERLRAAYDSLYEDDKAQVKNYDKLIAAEKSLSGNGSTTVIAVCCSVAAALIVAGAAAGIFLKKKKS